MKNELNKRSGTPYKIMVVVLAISVFDRHYDDLLKFLQKIIQLFNF
jgi:hypothetical protein